MRLFFVSLIIAFFASSSVAQNTEPPTALSWPGWATVEPMPADPISMIPKFTMIGTHTFSGYGFIFGQFTGNSVTVYVKEFTPQGMTIIRPVMIDVSGAQVFENGVPKIGSPVYTKDAKGNNMTIMMVHLTRSVTLKGGSGTDVNNPLNWSAHPYRISINSGW